MSGIAWGSDEPISAPKTVDTSVNYVEMEGFCFTPDGIRIMVTEAEKDDLLAQGYGPPRGDLDG